MSNFEVLLRKHNLRVTNPRRQVFAALSDASKPLTFQELYSYCPRIDRTSVYRTIGTLQTIGVIKIVYFGWKKLYELTDMFSPHHHHLRCLSCTNVAPIASDTLETTIKAIASQQHFTITSHHFEIDGICAECSRLGKTGPRVTY